MERYTSLYRLPQNQYTAGSPVLLAAGTLLKDSQTGAVLAQLKMQSLSAASIRAVMVAVDASDVSGAPLEGVAEYQYLDLSVRRDEAFGQHQAIVLPDANTRCIAVRCTRVVFADGTSWEAAPAAVWSSLPEPEALSEALGDEELVKQYRLKYGAGTKSIPQKHKDLWFCACGALNRADEEVCHVCGNRLTNFLQFDVEALKAEKDARLQKEADERRKAEEQAKAAAAEKAAKAKKAAAIICACIAVAVLLTQVIIPKQKYNKAMGMINAGEYDSAYTLLEEIGNTEAIAENKYDRAMDAIDAGDYDFAYTLLDEIGNDDAIAANKYDRAMELIDARDYEAAYALLDEIGDKEAIQSSKYDRAMEQIDAGDYDSAYALLKEIGNKEAIAANKYDRAIERIDAQDYEAAYVLLDELDYKDSEEKQESIKPQYYRAIFANAAIGDMIVFGSYEQDNNTSDGKEDVEWLVLAKEDNRLLVISQYALDCRKYNAEYENVTWENCTLRKWLNGAFFNTAFSTREKTMIPTVTVPADENPEYNTDPGNATKDKIFLLSIGEASRYFSQWQRVCVPTAYAKANGAATSRYYTRDGAGACWWFLRSPGRLQNLAAYVLVTGEVDNNGDYVNNALEGVRPAMWISLEE